MNREKGEWETFIDSSEQFNWVLIVFDFSIVEIRDLLKIKKKTHLALIQTAIVAKADMSDAALFTIAQKYLFMNEYKYWTVNNGSD